MMASSSSGAIKSYRLSLWRASYMLTKQTVFDTVKIHLLTQGAKSKIPGGYCLYRGPEGRKCAVGCLISDDVYSDEMEDLRLKEVVVKIGLSEHFDLLQRLQSVHDLLSVLDWEDALKRIANEEGLVWTS
jgi:hypothetical protein